MNGARVVSGREFGQYLQTQQRLALQEPNVYFAECCEGRCLRFNAMDIELIFRHWVKYAAQKFQQWWDGVSDEERVLIISARCEGELKKLVEQGQLRDLVGWFSYCQG